MFWAGLAWIFESRRGFCRRGRGSCVISRLVRFYVCPNFAEFGKACFYQFSKQSTYNCVCPVSDWLISSSLASFKSTASVFALILPSSVKPVFINFPDGPRIIMLVPFLIGEFRPPLHLLKRPLLCSSSRTVKHQVTYLLLILRCSGESVAQSKSTSFCSWKPKLSTIERGHRMDGWPLRAKLRDFSRVKFCADSTKVLWMRQ